MRKLIFVFEMFLLTSLCSAGEDRLFAVNTAEKSFEQLQQADTNGSLELLAERPINGSARGSKKAAQLQDHVIKACGVSVAREVHTETNENWSTPHLATDGTLSYVSMPHDFYCKVDFSHFAYNASQLLRLDGRSTSSSIDKARDSLELKGPKLYLDSLVNAWHKAASTGDENVFFEMMKPEGIYIGTDPTELWTAEEMEIWAAQYFQRDTAWHFTPIERNWYFSDAADVAWFDELLDTWMGVCRASGVMEKRGQHWQLRHYHLSVTVLNEKMDQLLKIKGIK